MTDRNARFYSANLGADVMRCAVAAEKRDIAEYEASLVRARHTLVYLHNAGRLEYYEEGLLLIRTLEYARISGELESFRKNLNQLITPLVVNM